MGDQTIDLPAELDATRDALNALERRMPRRSARLRLDFLDARTEHAALRLPDADLIDTVRRIRQEATATAA